MTLGLVYSTGTWVRFQRDNRLRIAEVCYVVWRRGREILITDDGEVAVDAVLEHRTKYPEYKDAAQRQELPPDVVPEEDP